MWGEGVCVELCVCGGVGVGSAPRLRSDGTGAGSAQREDFTVGVSRSDGMGAGSAQREDVAVGVSRSGGIGAGSAQSEDVVVGVSRSDGTGAGSAQREDVEVGVCKSDGAGAGVVHRSGSSSGVGVVWFVCLVVGVIVVVWVVLADPVSVLLGAAAELVVGVVVVVVGAVVFVGVILLADSSIASQSMWRDFGVVGVSSLFGLGGEGVGGLGIGLFLGWCLCPWCFS